MSLQACCLPWTAGRPLQPALTSHAIPAPGLHAPLVPAIVVNTPQPTPHFCPTLASLFAVPLTFLIQQVQLLLEGLGPSCS